LLGHVVAHDFQYDAEPTYDDFLRAAFISEKGEILPDRDTNHVGKLTDQSSKFQDTFTQESGLSFLLTRDLDLIFLITAREMVGHDKA
jgi:hypothetical protein